MGFPRLPHRRHVAGTPAPALCVGGLAERPTLMRFARPFRDAQTLIGIGYWCLIPGPTARRDEEPQRDTCSRAECQRAYASNDADCLTEREVGHTREPEQTSKNPSGNDENAAACHARSGSGDDFLSVPGCLRMLAAVDKDLVKATGVRTHSQTARHAEGGRPRFLAASRLPFPPGCE
jgi:hypothetical protein